MSGVNDELPDQTQASYLSALGLNQPPFSSPYQPQLIFKGANGSQRLDTLHQLIQQSKLLLVVTGDYGVGKTSLLNQFVNSAGDQCSISEVQANTMMDAHQLLSAIARGFGLNVTDQPLSVLQDTLYQYLITIQRNAQLPVLLVDDAHELPKDALETIFTLADAEISGGNLLRVILFCEPQIEIMLESASIQPLRERITHSMEIPAFNEEQTAEYIKHRMAVSGFTGTSPFKPEDIHRIYKVSHGIAGRINELAHLHLTGEAPTPVTDEAELPEEYTQLPLNKKRLISGSIVLALVLVYMLFNDTDSSLPGDETEPVQATKSVPSHPVNRVENTGQEKVIELTANSETKPATDNSQSVSETSSAQTNHQPLAEPATVIEQPAVIEPVKEQEQAKPEIISRIRSTLPNPVIGNRDKQNILINGAGFSEDTRIIVSWTGNKKELKRSQVTYENRNQLRIHITVGDKADTWTIQADDPVYGKSNVHEFIVTAAPATGLQTASWINRQSSDHFTLQLLGTYNKYSLTSFARQHKLDKDTAYFATRRNGGNWYTLVHGRFATRDAARQAIAKLSPELQNTKPWIRGFDGIQAITRKSSSSTKDADPVKSIAGNDSQPQSLDLTAHSSWLWSQNPAHYTIQLLAGHNLDALKSFMQKHQLQKQTSFYRTRRNGQQVFVLLYGSYPDRSLAKAAIEKLPAEIRTTRPWPRQFANIHGEMSSQ